MIVPGSPNALLLAQSSDPLDELGKIERSVRLRSSVGAYFSRTPAAAGNQTKWTVSFWIKRGLLGAQQDIYCANLPNPSNPYALIGLVSDSIFFDIVNAGPVPIGRKYTAEVKRDPCAHTHVVISFDSNNATAADRMKIEVNGSRVLAFSTSTDVSLAFAAQVNAAVTHKIGWQGVGSNSLDGYLSNFCAVDGQSLSSATFGQTHSRTNQWRPKSKGAIRAAVAAGGGARNGWGSNGFFLPFDDTTSTPTLGYDRSQSDTDTTGNNWTATNVSLTPGATYDSMLDTPTDNCAVFNRLLIPQFNTNMADGNLKATASYTSYNAVGRATVPVSTTKVMQAEMKLSVFGSLASCGVMSGGEITQSLSAASTGIGYLHNGQKRVAGVNSAYGAAWTTQTIGIVTDPIAQTVTFYKDGVTQGEISAPQIFTGDYFIQFYSDDLNNPTLYGNFGQQPYAYPVAGSNRVSTKNLPVKPAGPMKSTDAFAAVTDSGANIQTALAAVRAGWPAYIDIIKRRDAAEGWRWIFSDDPGKYLDSSNQGSKLTTPAFSGSSYAGYSLKVSASNGVATGTFVHVNGVASVVNDGLANSRKMVILHRESAGGGTWPTYHPELTAGKLLYLEQTSLETTDASINTVTASGFTVASTLASGTYRWISIAETAGFSRLSKHAGNGAVSGPLDLMDALPAFRMVKRTNTTPAAWIVSDNACNTANPIKKKLAFNNATYENDSSPIGGDAQNTCDFVAGGWKIRDADSPTNASGGVYVSLTFAAAPFRYANAR